MALSTTALSCLVPVPVKLEPELNDHVASITEHIPVEDLAR